METKEQLVNSIKKWVKIDNEIRKLQKELNTRKKEKMTLSTDLMGVMRKNEIDNINISNGKLIYTKKNVKKPLTQKILLDILSNYYKGDSLKVSELNNFILENREETVKENIIFSPNNKLEE
jgi:hypothetical protein